LEIKSHLQSTVRTLSPYANTVLIVSGARFEYDFFLPRWYIQLVKLSHAKLKVFLQIVPQCGSLFEEHAVFIGALL
jgi:hypothetical protein